VVEKRRLLFIVSLLFLGACGMEFPKIDRHPAVASWASRGALAAMPGYDPASSDPFQVDLRGFDLSALDLRDSLADLLQADFDDRTVWPPAERMPADFYWQRIMELGRNPGLGVRSLHERGITGQGVGIAIIDLPMLVDHQEYADQIRLYEEINIVSGAESQMHGPAVASIAVGQSVGVAPDADLYYIATWPGTFDQGEFSYDFSYLAQAVRRILEVDQALPARHKIRAISISVGWEPDQAGYDEITAAVEEAKAEGMLVLGGSMEETFGYELQGLGRDPLANPDAFESYEPGWRWAEGFYSGESVSDHLLVPMDARTTASPGGNDEYVFYRWGGLSWAIPYVTGVYTLACQVDPDITPDRFWELAMQTGRTIQITHEGQVYALGPILDPVALITGLQGK
jgi:hypothetical protein